MTPSKMQLEIEVDRCLRRFSDNLKPSEEYHDTGVRLCEKVLVSLNAALTKSRSHTKDPFTLPSAYYSGTLNAHNDPSPSPLEFQILIKVSNRSPPFTDVLDFMENTLRNNAFRLQISPRTIKVSSGASIEYSFTNGITCCIMPAPDTITHQEIGQKIKGNDIDRPCRYYSSLMVDKQIDFIKQQTYYAHKVCRLAKFWYQNMNLGENGVVIGGALMFDLLAISAVLEEEAKCHGREALLRAFTRVVELTESLDILALGFEREFGQYGQWRVKKLTALNNNNLELPRITEPNNPKVNILHGIDAEMVDKFKENGKAMRQRIEQLLEKNKFYEMKQQEKQEKVEGEEVEQENMVAKRRKVYIDFEALFGAKEGKEGEEPEEVDDEEEKENK